MAEINSEISSSFPCTKGVRQGCNLSPLLFSLYIADLKKQLYTAGSEGADLLDSKLCTLMFADDIVLIAHSPEDLQNSLNTLTNFCAAWDLQVNMKKTKIVSFNCQRSSGYHVFTFNGLPTNTLLNIYTWVCY